MEGGRQATCYRCTHPEGRWHISRDSLDVNDAYLHVVGSGGYIVSYSTFAAASRDVYVTLWTNYRSPLMKHTSGHYEISVKQIGNLPIVFSNASQWLPARSVSRNLRIFLDLTSQQGQSQEFTMAGF